MPVIETPCEIDGQARRGQYTEKRIRNVAEAARLPAASQPFRPDWR